MHSSVDYADEEGDDHCQYCMGSSHPETAVGVHVHVHVDEIDPDAVAVGADAHGDDNTEEYRRNSAAKCSVGHEFDEAF